MFEHSCIDPKFTILLPVHRLPHFLPYAVESVLRQSEIAFELFIICDGAPRETVEYARASGERDSRIRAFVFSKGEHHGEAHRHSALQYARGRFVAHIADDDLWFGDHLAELATLLESVDFGHLLQVAPRRNGGLYVFPADISDPGTRSGLRSHFTLGIGGPTVVGYRLEAYRRLPEGWVPPPRDTPGDLHLWRKFMALDGLRFGSRIAITSIHLDNAVRRGMSAKDRVDEMANWSQRIAQPDEVDRVRQDALLTMARKAHAFHLLRGIRLYTFFRTIARPRGTVGRFLWLFAAVTSRFRGP